jgi:CP family cyanate transporter-like MFS transporter
VSRIQPPSAASGRDRSRLERVLLLTGVLALGYNLRGAITSLPPVFPELQDSLHLSSATVSLLAAAPVICFGVVSGFAAGLARRAGEERVLLGASIVLVIGLVLRGAAPAVLLFPGTIASSGAIAVMNVLLSSLIKRRWPERAGLLIGLYITALSAGAIIGSLVSVPLWQATGGSVALTLSWVAAPAVLAVLLWLPQLSSGGTTPRLRARWQKPPSYRARGSAAPRPPRCEEPRTAPRGAGVFQKDDSSDSKSAGNLPTARVPVHRHALTWYVTIFMGMQSLVYYATLSWLPTMLRDRGESAAGAGDLLALMGVGNLAVSLLVPMAAQRMRSQVTLVVPTVMAIAGGLAALLYLPLGGAAAWALILGAGQNAALALAIFFTAARAPHAVAAASLSSLAQAVGYLLASAGPLEVGLLHSATGSWTVPVAVLLGLCAVMLVAGLLASRPRMLPVTLEEVVEAEGIS